MAVSGKPLDLRTVLQIQRLRAAHVSIRDTARATQTSSRTVQKHSRRRE
jgi:hypothetical protein